jgi:hypothetical protein
MTSVFSPLPLDARTEQRLAYRSFLAARDGALDVEHRKLARREEAMHRYLAPLAETRAIDRDLFDAQYVDYDPRRPTPPEVVLLLTLVKINAAEAYGVGLMIESVIARLLREPDDLDLIVTIEETYHTKILLSAASLYGLDVAAPYKPRASLRALMGVIAKVSPGMSRPLVLASELVGTLYFMDLLRVTREVLRDAPVVRDAIEERLTEVIIDEIGHVSFNRIGLGSAGLFHARMLLPIVAAGLYDAVPEFKALGLRLAESADRPLKLRAELPEEIRRRAFFA